MPKALIHFTHGLGDAVQLIPVIKHLRHFHPDWRIDVAALRGKHSLFHGVADNVYVADWYPLSPRVYDHYFKLDFWEHHSDIGGYPNTKATKALREIFKLPPIANLCRYEIKIRPEARARAAEYLREITGSEPREDGRFPVGVLHYEGNTSSEFKNLSHFAARKTCDAFVKHRLTPLVMDWDRRSPLPDGRTVFCPDAYHPLWYSEEAGCGLATGDGEIIAALIDQSVIMVGVDSGPLHIAGATTTPTIGVWTRHHPVYFFDLADNVVHMVPRGHDDICRKGSHDHRVTGQQSLEFFKANYPHQIYDQLDVELPLMVGDTVRVQSGYEVVF